MCNTGEVGDGCQSDEVCGGDLRCVPLLDIPTVIEISTCSVCADDRDCGDQLCSPSYLLDELSGSWACVDAGSVPDGQGCDLTGSGDEACEGLCASANVMGLLTLGVCGPCDPETNAGCGDGQTCQAPEVSFETGTLIPAACVDA